MPLAFHDAQAIAAVAQFPALIAHLRLAHRQPAPAVERALLRHRSASGSENAFLIWPAWQHERNLGVKVVTLFPDNRDAPAVQALYLLFDGANGAPQAILDGTELTYWKTAADSALGADYLARPDARNLLMVGAGRLAPYLIRAYQCIRPGLERVQVWNRTPAHAQALVDQVSGTPAAVAPDLQAAVRSADIVCCATPSRAPLIRGAWLADGAHLDLIGGYTPDMREADDDALRRARIFVDSRWFTVDHVGDLTQAISNGVIQRDDVLADLFDLCSGRHRGRASASEITLFKSGGGAHLDLMTAQYLADQLTTSP